MDYEEIYKAWINEREATQLRPLKKDFHKQSKEYVKNLTQQIEALDEGSAKRRLLDREVKNISKLVNDIDRMRNEKILEAALQGNLPQPEAFSGDEEKIHADLISFIEKSKKLLKDATKGYALEPKRTRMEEGRKTVLLRFLQAIPAIIGADMKTYGPFEVEDVAVLPAENAEALTKRGAAVVVETR